jgi:hypothetical protein
MKPSQRNFPFPCRSFLCQTEFEFGINSGQIGQQAPRRFAIVAKGKVLFAGPGIYWSTILRSGTFRNTFIYDFTETTFGPGSGDGGNFQFRY